MAPKAEAETSSPSPPPEGRPWSWLRRRYVVIGAAATATTIAIAVVLWYLYQPNKGGKISVHQTKAAPSGGGAINKVAMDDFLIHVRDDEGNIRVVSCGFILEVDQGIRAAVGERQTDLRKIIYEMAVKRPLAAFLDAQGHKAMKKDISDALEDVLGKGTIKAVYLSKCSVL
ncbi:MAG: flagellar basal body-associated FliL family protein [Syntrophales bacterium]|nr:flagellar basal body-associated FliL family protein [Syntrophales bacterium]